MACHQTAKPLSEPMLAYNQRIEAETKWPPFSRWHFQMHFHQWKFLNSLLISLKFVPMNIPALVQIMACCLVGTKPLSEPMMVSLLMHICITQPQWVNGILENKFLRKLYQNTKIFPGRKFIWKCFVQNGSHFSQLQCVNSTRPRDAYMLQ